MNYTYTIIMFISIFIFYISASIYTNEISSGTITNYISKPYKRYKIFVSKCITILIISLVIIFLILIENSILSSIFTKNNILSVSDVYVSGRKVYIYKYLYLFIKNYLIVCTPIFFCAVLTYCLSILTRSKSISLIITSLLFLFSPLLSTFLLNNNIKIIKYSFLPYLDFNMFLDKTNIIYTNGTYDIDLSIINGSLILFVYIIIFTIIGIIKMNKEEY